MEYYGYYNIIKENRRPFINLNNTNSIEYKNGATFEDIFSVFQMDIDLRNVMMKACGLFESIFKQEIVRAWCSHYGTNQSAYLNRSNYRSPRNNSDKLDNFLETLNYFAFHEDDDLFNYYRNNDGNIPPWILVKKMYLGQAIKWYTLLNPDLKNDIMKNMFSPAFINDIRLNDLKQLFGQFLSLIREFRNRAAHGGQIYLFSPKLRRGQPMVKFNSAYHAKFNIDQRLYDKGFGQTGIWTLNKFFSVLNFKEPYNNLNSFLNNRYKLVMVSLPIVNEFVNSNPLVSNIDENKFVQVDLFK
ncbi:hypothetical protein GHU05_04775 [Fructobacillus tropaeoli]|uniref:Abi family protein n=1 Tax=Fructobacillus tropaeoli TaxID=709323 RepID=UPI0014561560|nr:Abi family protein [Fructobacillus tropaeoli]NLS38241.1 hypothetical protein [Fructobacillus tropaeoli]